MMSTQAMQDDHWTMEVSGLPTSIDVAEVRRALGLLVDPDAVHMLTRLPGGRSIPIRGSDLEAGIRAVEALADGKGVYISLNPVTPTLNKAASDKDILERHNILIDMDPIRPPGMVGENATDEEHENAREALEGIRQWLTAKGWPAPLVIDSGNGWHLIYRVDLPNDALAKQWIKSALLAIKDHYRSDKGKLDTGVYPAKQITKLPGTWVRKGPHSPERPHRMAKLVSVPVSLVPVPDELIQALAGLKPPPKPLHDVDESNVWTMRTDQPDRTSYALTALHNEVERVARAPEGERNTILNEAAFNLGTLVGAGELQRADVEQALFLASTDEDREKTRDTIARAVEAGMNRPRELKDDPRPFATTKPQRPAVLTEDDLVIFGHQVVPRKIEWFWLNRIPRGFITMLAGQTGVGKSFTTMDLIARHSRGEEMPDGLDANGTPGALIITEDPIDTMAVPRLIEVGAEMDRIAFMKWEAMAYWTLDNIDMLERTWMKAGQPDIVLIDPPTNFLDGKIDEHKNSAVRRILMPLVQWLDKRHVAGVLISHVNKQSGPNIDAINRVIGSVAWMTTARIGHAYAKDPNDPTRCLALPLKTNVGAKPTGLAYRLVQTESLARVEWCGEVDITADDALSQRQRKKPSQEDALEFLLEQFRAKYEWASDDLIKLANERGIHRQTLWRATKHLEPHLRRRQISRQWVWSIAPDAPCLKEGWEPGQTEPD